MALQFVDPEVELWEPIDDVTRRTLLSYWANLSAFSTIEAMAARLHPLSDINGCHITTLTLLEASGHEATYRFLGTAHYRHNILRGLHGEVSASGNLKITLDAFGRIQESRVAQIRH